SSDRPVLRVMPHISQASVRDVPVAISDAKRPSAGVNPKPSFSRLIGMWTGFSGSVMNRIAAAVRDDSLAASKFRIGVTETDNERRPPLRDISMVPPAILILIL